ncbi:MAG: glycosyltransferase family 39 protein [bacterium]|nr:glycosyltransferase family 39 protein [bacterium]
MLKACFRTPLLPVFLAALVVKVIILLLIIPELREIFPRLYQLNMFPDGYDKLAVNLMQGNGYRFYPETAETLLRAPGYALFLSIIFLSFGKNLIAVKLVNLILTFITAWIVMRIARRFGSSDMVTLLSPLLFLFHPAVILAESRGGLEILLTCLTTLFMLVLYEALERKKRVHYFLAGSVLGLTALVKSSTILFPAFLCVYLLFMERNSRTVKSILTDIAAMVIAMLVVLSPWIIRNYSLTGKFIPTQSILGFSAGQGLYACKHLSTKNDVQRLVRHAARQQAQLAKQRGLLFRQGFIPYFYSSEDEVEFGAYLWKRVRDEYQESPSLLVRCSLLNLYRFWFGGRTKLSTGLNIGVQLPFLILAITGLYLCIRNGQARRVGPMILFIAYYVAVHLPILGLARYSVPLIPFLAFLACIPLGAAWSRRTPKGQA